MSLRHNCRLRAGHIAHNEYDLAGQPGVLSRESFVWRWPIRPIWQFGGC
jgi:hypothetical protein